jgi:RNA polymerase sigma factor (sigma-70 family)
LGHLSDDEVRAAFEAPGTPQGVHAAELLWEYLFRAACRLARRGEDYAQDLAQETFLRAFQGYPRFRGRCTITTWCHAILNLVYLEQLRKDGRPLPIVELPPVPINQAFLEALDHCIGRLSAKHRTVFVGILLRGQRAEELAALLGTTKGNVDQLLHKARGRVLACLEESDWAWS